MSKPVKYPIEHLRVGDALILKNPPIHVRGCLYARAENLGIRVTVRKTKGWDGRVIVKRVA